MSSSSHLISTGASMTYAPISDSLEGRQALITGGTKGMGRDIADRLAFAGATVLVTARTAPANQDVAFVAADVGTAEGVATMVDQVRQRFGGADILVDNVGGSPP
jgi:NAD(P)-dependent dehydrogenase (short-subunit alcohol dehydrogenase family)